MLTSSQTGNRTNHSLAIHSRWFILGLIAVTLLGAAVRWSFLDHPMRYDEAMNYLWFGSRSPQYIATHYNPNNHVLHTLFARFAGHWLGTSPAGLRFATYVGGVLLIPLTAWLAWSLFQSRWVALITALAAAGSSQLIEYSANARGYMWLTVFTTLCVICTRYALDAPHRKAFWFALGSLGALGAYVLPLMIYPMCGLLAAVAVAAFRPLPHRQRRRELLRGALVTAGVCGALTALLYLPILIVQGLGPVWETRRMTYDVWGPRVGSFSNMLAMTWSAWTRDAGPLWGFLFPAGMVAFVISTLRKPAPRNLLPLIATAVALAIVWLQGAPLRARAWLPFFPLFLACAVQGMRTLCPRDPSTLPRRLATIAAGSAFSLAALLSLDNVRRQPYLCSEPNVLVNVEEVIDEWSALGGRRCALVMRFTPAARYYRLQKGIAAPPVPGSPEAERVLIVVQPSTSLNEQWNETTDGHTAYRRPVLWRKLSHCALYVADKPRVLHRVSSDGESQTEPRP